MFFRQIVDEKLAQYAYLIGCQATGEAIVIDPERDIDRYIDLADKEGLVIVAVADTHIHADYLTGMREFAERGIMVFASDEGDADWKYEWLLGSDYTHQLLKHGDTFKVGNIQFEVVHSPGHTPEHVSYLITDLGGGADAPMGLASGDFVFVGDLGRPDLLESAAGISGMMEPSARTLRKSVLEFLKLDDYIQIWPAHGAGSACGKALGAVPESTVGYERRFNGAIQAAIRGEDEFVASILDGQPEPPMYFARMKRDNRAGPAVLGSLPQPRLLSADELAKIVPRRDAVILDTRIDRGAFMAGHLPGSLYAPLDKTFNTIAGSYVEENTPIYLIVDTEHVEVAVRDLIRIGLDDIVGYATPDTLEHYKETGELIVTTEQVTLRSIPELAARSDVSFLDVRNMDEYRSSHIAGAENIAHTRLLVRRDEVRKDGHVAVYCRTGARAAYAASLLQRLGHDVIHIDGDYEAWSAENETVSGLEMECR